MRARRRLFTSVFVDAATVADGRRLHKKEVCLDAGRYDDERVSTEQSIASHRMRELRAA